MLQRNINPKITQLFNSSVIVLTIVVVAILIYLLIKGDIAWFEGFAIIFFGGGICYALYQIISSIHGLSLPQTNYLPLQDYSGNDSNSFPISADLVEAINKLDFNIVGSLGLKELGGKVWQCYVDKQNHTLLLVGKYGKAHLESIFEDGLISRANIETLGISAEKLLINLNLSYQLQESLINQLAKNHGEVKLIEGLNTWQDWDKVFGYRHLRATFMQKIKLWLAWLLVPIYIVLVGMLLEYPVSEAVDSIRQISANFILIIAVILVIWAYMPRIFLNQKKRKNSE